jgi:hypothetical protein
VTRAGLDSFLGPYTGGTRRCPQGRKDRRQSPVPVLKWEPSKEESGTGYNGGCIPIARRNPTLRRYA